MPTRRLHLKFDRYLMERNIVGERDYSSVHNKMDADIELIGHWYHREKTPEHNEEGFRKWLRSWCHAAYQDTLTHYLRVALGHILLDDINTEYEFENKEELIKSVYRSYIQRGYSRCFFRE